MRWTFVKIFILVVGVAAFIASFQAGIKEFDLLSMQTLTNPLRLVFPISNAVGFALLLSLGGYPGIRLIQLALGGISESEWKEFWENWKQEVRELGRWLDSKP